MHRGAPAKCTTSTYKLPVSMRIYSADPKHTTDHPTLLQAAAHCPTLEAANALAPPAAVRAASICPLRYPSPSASERASEHCRISVSKRISPIELCNALLPATVRGWPATPLHDPPPRAPLPFSPPRCCASRGKRFAQTTPAPTWTFTGSAMPPLALAVICGRDTQRAPR